MEKKSVISIVFETFSYLDKETKLKSAFSATISLINASLEFLVTLLAYPLVLSISNNEHNNFSKFTDKLPESIQTIVLSDQTLFWTICIVAIFVIKNAFFLFQNWWNFGFTQISAAKISKKLLSEYVKAPYLWHLTKNPSELHRNINNSVDSMFINIVVATLNVITELFLLLIIALFFATLEPVMFIYSSAFLMVSGCIYTLVFGRISSIYGKRQADSYMQITKSLFHALGGIKEARVLGREGYLVNQYATLRRNHADIARVVSMIATLPRAFLEIMLALAMLFGIIWITNDRTSDQSVAILGTFGFAAIRLMPAVGRILNFFNMVRIGEAALHNVAPQMQSAKRVPSPHSPARRRPPFLKELKLHNLFFSYNTDTSQPSLKNINLSIKKGQYVGIVGASGAGKSTLVDIILGVLSPTKGEVLLDGVDISGNPEIWNGMLGYVPQSIYLVDDTIERNIAFGLKDKEVDQLQLQQAIENSQLKDFVGSLELGLNSMVGDRGVRLSGGQIQRIGIARALYGMPEILIMDEGTSALDGSTEAKLTAAVDSLRSKKTIILIAHRLSTIKNCDKIVVLDQGEIVDIGNYNTLLERCTLFREMVEHADLG